MKPISALCFILSLFVKETYSIPNHKLLQSQSKLQEKTTTASHRTTNSEAKKNGRVFYPIGYGADPNGKQDSSDAILNALTDAFQAQKGLELLPGVNDLGGVIIDLQGGNYMVSKPLRFPTGGGNLLVQGGTLRASDIFPGDRHLIELWSSTSQKLDQSTKTSIYSVENLTVLKQQNGGTFYEDITFRDILFDSSFRGGGIFIIDSARIRINSCFFVHFTTEGILVQNGHETFITNCFLGQHPTVGGDPGEKDFSGTAIDLASNDNLITDVAIFSAATGIILRGQANIVTGVHCYNKATSFGGVGILVKLGGHSQTRIDNCYLDYTGIEMEDPVQVHVTNGFFLGDANVVVKSINGQISGLNIVDNMFTGNPNKMKPIIQLDGQFTNIDQVVIDRNNVNGMSLKSTVGKLTVNGNGTKWVADFSSILVFPNRITHFGYSFYSKGGFPVHAVTNVSNNVVVVESERAVSGVVSVIVDQYNMVGEMTNFLM